MIIRLMKPKAKKTICILAALFSLSFTGNLSAQSKVASSGAGISADSQTQPSRTWESSNGKFKIDAQLVKCDTQSVTLLKPDESTIVVPIDKLCQADRDYLQAFRDRQARKIAALPEDSDSQPGDTADVVVNPVMAPFATTTVAEILPLEEFEGISYDPDKKRDNSNWPHLRWMPRLPGPEVLDPNLLVAPVAMDLAEAGVLVEKSGMHQRLEALIPVGGPDKLLLAGLSGLKIEEQYDLGAVFWISLAQQKLIGKVYLPRNEMVVDYAPEFGRLLTMAQRPEESLGLGDGGEISLTLWDLPAGGKQATALVRWRTMIYILGEEQRQARILSEDHVIYSIDDFSNRGVRYSVLNVAAKNVVHRYFIKPVSNFGTKVQFSPSRKFLFVTTPEGVVVRDSHTGEDIAGLPCKSPVHITCSPDGKKIAVMTPQSILIWNVGSQAVANAKPVLDVPHQCHKLGGQANLSWVDDRFLMIGTTPDQRFLFDIEKEWVVWEYKMDDVQLVTDLTQRAQLVHTDNGYLIYPIDLSEANAIGCVKLPGDGVAQSAREFNTAGELILKHGSEVKVKIVSDTHQDEIRETIEQKIRDNGWVINDASKIEVVATLKTGTRTTDLLQFEDKTSQPSFFVKEISYSRVSYSVRIGTKWVRRGSPIETKQGIWSGYLQSSVLYSPSELRSPENAIKLLETVDPKVFEKIDIPAEITDPRRSLGAGWTIVNRNGLDKQP